jgi:hypothetical protein
MAGRRIGYLIATAAVITAAVAFFAIFLRPSAIESAAKSTIASGSSAAPAIVPSEFPEWKPLEYDKKGKADAGPLLNQTTIESLGHALADTTIDTDNHGRRGLSGAAPVNSYDGFRLAVFQREIRMDGGVPLPPELAIDGLARCAFGIVNAMATATDSTAAIGIQPVHASEETIGKRLQSLGSSLNSDWRPVKYAIVSPNEQGAGTLKIEESSEHRLFIWGASQHLSELTKSPAVTAEGKAVGASFDFKVRTASEEERRMIVRFSYHATERKWAIIRCSIEAIESSKDLVAKMRSGSREPITTHGEKFEWDMFELFPEEVLWVKTNR